MPSSEKPSSSSKPSKPFVGPHTLAIDIGGTGLKASVLDAKGGMETDRVRVETPYPCTPKVMVETLSTLIKPLPAFDRVSVGFPGVVREGRVITAPHFGNEIWSRFPLAEALEKKWGKPARILNDADMQGLAVIQGKGLELVVTLGTGVGTALFRNGQLMPHLELAQHPARADKTYNEYIGDEVLKQKGKKKWNRRVRRALDQLLTLVNYDWMYIGGGNATQLDFKLAKNVKVVSNQAGILGGIALWKEGALA
jgi:polyphosphate glucokinase